MNNSSNTAKGWESFSLQNLAPPESRENTSGVCKRGRRRQKQVLHPFNRWGVTAGINLAVLGDDGEESSEYCTLESESDSELCPDEEDANDSTGAGDMAGGDSYHTMNMGSEDPETNVGAFRVAEED
ncbi:hypothetical protein PIB30_080083 [Stylosanthes scabra]|uniref:Uncharacterized protein n=1 Tax=Stylosanthes scabra TaxID=79078 RepID=A0ABU6UTP1_9FABA|nr:hypothetical protein [Stylosanthes scabra]